MKNKSRKKSIVSILLCICMMGQIVFSIDFVRAAEGDVKWTKYSAKATYTGSMTEDATGVTLNSRVAAYYTEKISVYDGTKISMDVQIPTVVSGQVLQYAFGLTTGANSFYTADETKVNTTMVTELTSLANGTNLTANACTLLPAGSRTIKVNAATLTSSRNAISTTTYQITFEKQVATSDTSWVITAQEKTDNGNSRIMNISKDDIAHDAYSGGAYIITGALCGTANTVKISNVTVIEPEDLEDENAIWKVVEDVTTDGTLTESESYNGDATFTNKVAAYYKEKIEVKDNTKISFKVKYTGLSDTEMLHYGFSLVNKEGTFYTSDNAASSMITELQSSATNNWMVSAIASKRIAPAGRQWIANVGNLASKRTITDTFEIVFEKIDETVGSTNYSWKLTATNLTSGSTYSYKVSSTNIAHDLYKDGAYLAVGVMNGNGYTMELTDVSVGTWQPKPDTAWEAVRGYDDMDFTTSSKDAITLIGGLGGVYRKETFTLKNHSYISLQYEAKELTKNNSNDFWVMWLDKPSMANGTGDSGNGYAVQMRTSADFTSFTLFLREVVKGKVVTDGAYASVKLGGGTINANALNQKIDVKFTRSSQKLDGVEYYGSVIVTVAGKSYTQRIRMDDAKRVYLDLDKELYLMAGTMNNVKNIVEVKNVKMEAIPVIQSVGGLWKPIYGYSADTLSAIVNKKTSVELYGRGAAYLTNPWIKTSNATVSLSLHMSELTADYHNKFSFAVLDENDSFIGQEKATGTGFMLEVRSFDQYEKGYAVYISTVIDGKAENFEKLNDSIVLGDMSKAEYDITMTRNSNGSWKITVADKTHSKTLSYTLDSCKALEALTPGNIYLSAGNTGMDLNAVIGY